MGVLSDVTDRIIADLLKDKEARITKLEEALKECVEALQRSACPDCKPDSDLCIARGFQPCHLMTAITKAREVLGDD